MEMHVILSRDCRHSMTLVSTFKEWAEVDGRQGVLINDFTDRTIKNLLKAFGVTHLPAVVLDKVAHQGTNAFEKMSELTGVPMPDVVGSTSVEVLYNRHCDRAVRNYIAKRNGLGGTSNSR